jgi:hypothetical protein
MSTNAQVFAAFAQGRTAKGGSVNSVAHPNGVVLYSYATPIAFNCSFEHNFGTDSESPIFDERKYSVTTSKQTNAAKRACGTYTEINHSVFRDLCAAQSISVSNAR